MSERANGMSDRDKQSYVEIGMCVLLGLAVHFHWWSVLAGLGLMLYFVTLARFGKSE